MGDSWELEALSKPRRVANRLTEVVVGLGGAAVLLAIALIFFYLVWIVVPLFAPASIDAARLSEVSSQTAVLLDISENDDAVLKVSTTGDVEFYDAASGQALDSISLGRAVSNASRVYPNIDLYAVRDHDDQLVFFKTRYLTNFAGNTRSLTPKIEFPFGSQPVVLPPATTIYDTQFVDSTLTIASLRPTSVGDSKSWTLRLSQYQDVEEGYPLRTPEQVDVPLKQAYSHVWIGPRAQWLYLLSSTGDLLVVGMDPISRPARLVSVNVKYRDTALTAAAALLGRYSLVIADSAGGIGQWFLLRDEVGYRMSEIRRFENDTPAQRIVTEPRRKGFATLDAAGELTLLYPTSQRVVAKRQTPLKPESAVALSPRSDRLIGEALPGKLASFRIHNDHPEISLRALWAKVWYESYPEPVYSWQSSAADNDFEPKFSLMPLAFGTLKAAFYALVFAIPIGVMGAIYTAYFMAPAMRSVVKPGIEIMAALPTVILGFIGGLWLAPIVETHLSSVLSIFLLLPVALIGFASLWWIVPDRFTKPLTGWYGLLVIPLIVGCVVLSFAVGPPLENSLFGGDSRSWFQDVLGLDFDQRNALVVGLVMGLSVIPTIFSISEDAIYGVPRHLSNGSLALGATPWQTLVRVVLLTASPRHFLCHHDWYGTGRWRNHDRADGNRKYAANGHQYL